MKLNLIPIPSNLFNYQGALKSFCAERSDLNGYDIEQQLYDDACDVGFEMVSERTGDSRIFLFNGVEGDDEGDIVCWNFTMLNKDMSESDITCTIFND